MIEAEKKYILKQIDEAIRYVWMVDIASDYDNGWLLKEDTLKNAMYYYLRMKLSNLLEQYDLRIFTEFTDDKFQGTGYRPDMVIAEMNFEKGGRYYGNDVAECICVFELKYKAGTVSPDVIYNDYEKLRYYYEDLKVDCPMYMATIWEYEDDETTWIRKNAAWAKNRVTELNASYDRKSKNMRFYIGEH